MLRIKVHENYDINDLKTPGDVFQILYQKVYRHWFDYEDRIDDLETAFQLGAKGNDDWAPLMGGRGSYYTPDYLDSAFRAGKRYSKCKTEQDYLDFIKDETDF